MTNDIISYHNTELKSWFLTQTTLSDHCKGMMYIYFIYKYKYLSGDQYLLNAGSEISENNIL